MRKSQGIMARILVVAACIIGAIFFFQQFDSAGSWQFYAALGGFICFLGFAVLVFKKTK
jgi:membrane associated rhomboid family serine protease